mgnify:CR=1 FL=1
MSECTHDCSSCGESCGERTAPMDFRAPMNPLSDIKKVIAVVSGKGGVGKSLVTSSLAVAMRRMGKTVGVLDADITGPSIPTAFGLTERAVGDGESIFPEVTAGGIEVISLNLLLENKGDPVVWRGSLLSGVVKQFWTDVRWGQLDYLFIDMPPGTGDVPLTVFQSLPVAGVVVVTSPQELVGMIVDKAVNMADMMHVPVLGIVENMAYYTCPDCGKFLLFVKGKRGEMLVCPDRECGYRKSVTQVTNARCPNCFKKMELRGEGENQMFACVCGYREKLSAFQERRKSAGAGKRDVAKYLQQQKDDKPVNSGMADALAKWLEKNQK